MMRKSPIVFLAILLLLLAALILFLSTQAREVPVAPIEVEVSRSGNAQ